MTIGDPNSFIARTRYRIRRLLHRGRLIIRFLPTPAPAIDANAILAAETVGQPEVFVEDAFGSGAFGQWVLDEAQMPAYRYDLNQFEDDRATYPVSHGAFRRDHWHQVGNDHLNALASNDGMVQVFVAERGFLFLNHFDYGQAISLPGFFWEALKILATALFRALKNFGSPYVEPSLMDRLGRAFRSVGAHRDYDQKYAYSGGFAYLDDGHELWSTAYRYSPKLRPTMQRVFGMGYYQTVTEHRNIAVTRRVYAPAGDVSALLIDVELKNTSSRPITVDYYEYWDINFHQIQFQPFRSGFFAGKGDSDRRFINTLFTPCIAWISSARALRFHHEPPSDAPAPDVPCEVNWHPRDVFLADLSGGDPPQWYFDKAKFFGKGDAERPDSIGRVSEADTSRVSGVIMPYCMVLRRKVTLEVGATVSLRFAYGTILPDPTFDCAHPTPQHMPDSWSLLFHGKYGLNNPVNDPFHDTLDHWRSNLAYFTTGDAHFLQREMAWHSYYLQSSTVYSDFFANRFVPQGSFYLYGQGIDGVPRDFALFSLPLVYINPGLARDVIKSIMKLTRPENGQIAYSYTGNGALTDALVHKAPSDLDLFLLLAITEYLSATGDIGFLHENVSFYPADSQPQNQTVLYHIQLAFYHLTQTVLIGDSGLLHVRDGDWSDDVVLRNTFPAALFSFRSFPKTVVGGESVPNTQMALYVLPRIAALLQTVDSEPARQLGAHMDVIFRAIEGILSKGVQNKWNKKDKYFARAVLRTFTDKPYTLHENQLDLEAQVWALIGQRSDDAHLLTDLQQSVYRLCDQPSPLGPMLASHDVWPAVAQLLTWGYVSTEASPLALQAFLNLTFANKAELYGDSWIDIWSGPDGINGPTSAEPGGTYNTFPVTPTTDFPVMNNNQHAMMLLALMRICGIEPAASGDGLRISPTVLPRFALKLPLLSLDVSPRRIRGEYHAHNRGTCALHVRLPSRSAAVEATINGRFFPVTPDQDGYVRLVLPNFDIGDHIAFDVFELRG